MPKRMIVFVPAILVFLPAAVLSTARTSFAQRAADDCITKPNSAPPQGSHWYFRVDRTVRRQCWYLGPEGAKVQAGARRAESPTRPPPRRPISPTPGESLVGAADARTTPAQFRAGENDADANFILRWPGLSPSTATSKPTSISNSASTSNSYAEEHPTTNGQDDLPLIWPVLTPADLGAAGPLLASAVGPERIRRACVCCRDGFFDFQTVDCPPGRSIQPSRSAALGRGLASPTRTAAAGFRRQACSRALGRFQSQFEWSNTPKRRRPSVAAGVGSGRRRKCGPPSSCQNVLVRYGVRP